MVEVEKRLLSMVHLGKLKMKFSSNRYINSSKVVIKWRDLLGIPVEVIAEELSEFRVRQIGIKETGIYVLTFDMPTPPQQLKCAYIRLPVEQYLPNPMVWPHNEQMQQQNFVWQMWNNNIRNTETRVSLFYYPFITQIMPNI